MKKILRTLMPVIVIAIVFSACKKDTSRKDLIVGTWTQTALIMDTNGNGNPDDSVYTVQTGQSNIVTLKSNGTGTEVTTQGGTSSTLNFTWSLTNNDNTITIVETGTMSTTVSVAIIELTSSKLTVENKTTTPFQWSYFSR